MASSLRRSTRLRASSASEDSIPPAREHEVVEPPGEPAVRGASVAAGAPRLLVVGLERGRQVAVDDEADVGLVDAHAEGDRGDHDHRVARAEPLLVRRARAAVEPGVVGQRVEAAPGEEGRGLLDRGARRPVDDARGAAPAPLEQRRDLGVAAVALDHPVEEVRAIEAGDEGRRARQQQPLVDLAPGRGIGGGGERQARHRGEALAQHAELEVLRAEVVPPLRHTVRLVDREERQARTLEQRPEPLGRHPFGRDVDEVELPRRQPPLAFDASPGARFECSAAAATPTWRSAATWSSISEMSGETTTPVPSRSSAGIW